MATLQIFASQQFFIQSVRCQHVTRGAVCKETSFPSPDRPAIAAESHAHAEWNARLEVVFSLWERLSQSTYGVPRCVPSPGENLEQTSAVPASVLRDSFWRHKRFMLRKRYQYSVTVLIDSHRKITVRNCLEVQLRRNIKGWLLSLM